MTEKELRTWMRKESLSDAWFVSANEGHVDGDLLTLEQIFQRYGGNSATVKAAVWILHENQQNRKDPAWVEFDLTSFDGDTASPDDERLPQPPSTHSARRSGRSSERSKRRTRGMMVQIIVLLLFVAAGLGVWYFATREEAPTITFVSEEEAHFRMLANLEQNLIRNNPTDPSEQGEPIRTVVSATQRMLMIKNSNLENWPSFYMRITSPEGKVYECDFGEVIPAYSTLSISMRKIVTADGQALSRDDLKSGTTIELRVPGYKDWSSRL